MAPDEMKNLGFASDASKDAASPSDAADVAVQAKSGQTERK